MRSPRLALTKSKHTRKFSVEKGAKGRTESTKLNKEENCRRKQKRIKRPKSEDKKQDKTQNKTNRRYKREREQEASDEKDRRSSACAVCFPSRKWFFNELLLYTTKIFYKRRRRMEEKKTFFRPHKKFSHGRFFSWWGRCGGNVDSLR